MPVPEGIDGEKISWMQPSEIQRALTAAMSTASALGLAADDTIVLHNSNALTVRLLPCDVAARVAPGAHQVARFEIELAQRLAESGSPVAVPDPRAGPCVYESDGFAITLWSYYKPAISGKVPAADYADALERLHAGMRKLTLRTPHFTERVDEAQHLVETIHLTPDLADADRRLLITTLRSRRQAITGRGAAEQVLHGEPHPGNVLSTKSGLLFIDFETCCRGPVEFDLAHVPEDVSERYTGADQDLLSQCRALVLAMVAAWRWDLGDQFPDRERAARALLRALRMGPPWPPLDAVLCVDPTEKDLTCSMADTRPWVIPRRRRISASRKARYSARSCSTPAGRAPCNPVNATFLVHIGCPSVLAGGIVTLVVPGDAGPVAAL